MRPDVATFNHEAGILSRAIDPANGNWPLSVAEGVLTVSLSPKDRDRMNQLAAKAQDGVLTGDEEVEIESFRQACRLLEWLKAKAHASVKQSRPFPPQ